MIEREVVYFISTGDSVKVGRTTNLVDRLRAVRTHNSRTAVLLGALPGGGKLERAIHKELRAFRLSGEWFALNSLVSNMIEAWLSRGIRGEERALNYTNPAKKPRQSSRLDETSLVDEAVLICEALVRLKQSAHVSVDDALDRIADETGVGVTTLWTLRYRKPNYVTAGVLEALRCAQRQTLPRIVSDSKTNIEALVTRRSG